MHMQFCTFENLETWVYFSFRLWFRQITKSSKYGGTRSVGDNAVVGVRGVLIVFLYLHVDEFFK